MKRKTPSLSPAHISGILLLSVAAVCFFFNPVLTAVIAFFYIVLCIAASFFPQSRFYLPVVSRGRTGKNFVALTFDDGPSPMTRDILDVLDRHGAPATFFVSGVNALRYPEIIRDIIARGHDIGNHSFHHNPFLMLRPYGYLYREVLQAQKTLEAQGVRTFAFRPPVGVINPKLPRVLNKLGMYCVTFSCRAFDAGNRRVNHLADSILKKVKADNIVLLHDAPPPGERDHHPVVREVETILQGLKEKNLIVVPLSALIGRTVMEKIP